jgi:probable rRNA maturation factor
MKFNLEINNQTKAPLSRKYFERVILEAIKSSKVRLLGKLDLSLAIVSQAEIRKINRIYRKKNKSTDVLSFSDYKKGKKDVFSELIVCYNYVKKSSMLNRISLKKEMAYVISHGIFHCLGFKHGKEMFNLQDKVSSKFK